MISKNTDNQPWYRLKVRNKGLIEEAKHRLTESSISFVYLSDKTYPASCLQFLASNYVQFLYVNTDIDTITNFLEKEKDSNIYKLSRDNHNVPVLYDDLIIRQTEMILHNYNGEIRITNSIPSKAKECSIDYLHMKDFKGYYQKVQKAPIDKFYIKLLENINIFIPVPKGTYKEPTEKKEEEKLYREKTRWMVLRTFNEEKWYDILCNWNIDMADAIRRGEARPCFPFLSVYFLLGRNGKHGRASPLRIASAISIFQLHSMSYHFSSLNVRNTIHLVFSRYSFSSSFFSVGSLYVPLGTGINILIFSRSFM